MSANSRKKRRTPWATSRCRLGASAKDQKKGSERTDGRLLWRLFAFRFTLAGERDVFVLRCSPDGARALRGDGIDNPPTPSLSAVGCRRQAIIGRMVRFDILTIFPDVFEPYLKASIVGRAQRKQLVKIRVHDLRRWARDKHRTVDDKPYGGGPGMILKVEPIYRAVTSLHHKNRAEVKPPKVSGKGTQRTRVILFSASGKLFDQRTAERYAKNYDRLILICGRYEGVDARVGKYIADEELSIGPYVLTGGELPAMVVVDAVTRLVAGVINPESLLEESFGLSAVTPGSAVSAGKGRRSPVSSSRPHPPHAVVLAEYPQYTRPEVFYPDAKNTKIAWRVPKILLTGNHRKISAWQRQKMRLMRR